MDRPLGVTLLALLNFISGIFCFIGAVTLVWLSAVIPPSAFEEFGPLASLIFSVGGLIFVVLGAVAIIVGYGLWIGASWAWWISVILTALNVLQSLLTLPAGVVGIVIGAVILYYLTRPHVKEYFGV
ncbi:hypothetical protein [Archaeoglobus neptunius]|uniref:hypothetical protein n=1 Tax=Archaeoglobus neptunius TaxID=2798580 RepID=UPI0019280F84|nr:hypothetical protein [Archaeoglobus neptunius]